MGFDYDGFLDQMANGKFTTRLNQLEAARAAAAERAAPATKRPKAKAAARPELEGALSRAIRAMADDGMTPGKISERMKISPDEVRLLLES